MRKENSVWNNIPYNWRICGGMIVPPPNHVASKKKKVDDFHYTYHLIKEGDKWYDYHYIDTADFNIGDTLVLTIRKVKRK